MTNAYASTHGRSFASTADAGFAAAFDRARTAWQKHRTYRRTLAELRDLSDRVLSDLNFKRSDLNAIAHRTVYGL